MKVGSIHFVSLALVGLWLFPSVWYKGASESTEFKWFETQTEVDGMIYSEVDVGAAAEAILAADSMENGEFSAQEGGAVVRVFSAKRKGERKNATGLLTHTPDSCWTRVGMRAEDDGDFVASKSIDGVEMTMERRIYSFGSQRELVYFGAIVGGKALPYRLDTYLNAALGTTVTGHQSGPWSRAFNSRVWTWCWDSFAARTQLGGAQQLIRISTPIRGDLEEAEQRIDSVLEQWLKRVG